MPERNDGPADGGPPETDSELRAADSAGAIQTEDHLDREHQARVSNVASCDSADARRAAAEAEMGLLTEEEQLLLAERNAQGSDEHVDAIRRSGWYPYARPIRASARLMWLFDAVLWIALWASIWWMWMRVFNNG